MKTKILLMFCVMLLTTTPVLAANIVSFNITDTPIPSELSGMFTIDFDNGNMPTSIMINYYNLSFDLTDLLAFSITEFKIGVDASNFLLLAPAAAPTDWKPGGATMEVRPSFANPAICVGDCSDGLATYTPKTPPIPEPTTMMLLSTGLVGLIGYRWKKARA